MNKVINRFIKEEDGIATVETVIILGVLVGLAFIFRKAILKYSTDMMAQMFQDVSITNGSVMTDAGAQKVLDGVGASIASPTPLP